MRCTKQEPKYIRNLRLIFILNTYRICIQQIGDCDYAFEIVLALSMQACGSAPHVYIFNYNTIMGGVALSCDTFDAVEQQ